MDVTEWLALHIFLLHSDNAEIIQVAPKLPWHTSTCQNKCHPEINHLSRALGLRLLPGELPCPRQVFYKRLDLFGMIKRLSSAMNSIIWRFVDCGCWNATPECVTNVETSLCGQRWHNV